MAYLRKPRKRTPRQQKPKNAPRRRKQQTLDQTGEITPLTTIDLSYTYRTKSIGNFSIAVINVLGSMPPLDASNPNGEVNYSLYDPNGRQVVLGYQVKI